MDNDEWDWKSKLTVYSGIIIMFITIILYAKSCASGDFFNSPSAKEPTMRPIGGGNN